MYAAGPVPSIKEWQELWAAWDSVTRQMIPQDELLSKPIKLRNACIFYLGHIPTFLDIHLTRASQGKPTEPAYFQKIFERGIDPDVDNPDLCHDHSEIPDTWPPLEAILRFQESVRERTNESYASGAAENNYRVSRALWLAFEHEAMHLETLLYMLVQSERVLPPPGVVKPDFEALAQQSEALAVENEWFSIPESRISTGLKDPDNEARKQRYFGWDSEKPPRALYVKAFKAKARPITNGEYAEYLARTGQTSIPASWCEAPISTIKVDGQNGIINGHTNGCTNGEIESTHKAMEGRYIRTVFGAVPLQYALHWAVVASYDELAGCARWMGGRIPTMEEVRCLYNSVERGKMQKFDEALGHTIPAVNRSVYPNFNHVI